MRESLNPAPPEQVGKHSPLRDHNLINREREGVAALANSIKNETPKERRGSEIKGPTRL